MSMKLDRKVFVYRRHLLPLSETFISEQVLAYRAWRGILIGHRPGQLSLARHEVRILGRGKSGLAVRIARKLRLLAPDRGDFGIESALEDVNPRMLKSLKEEGAVLVHTHFGVDAVASWPLAEELGLPMLVTLHGYDINTHREWWEQGYGGEEMRAFPQRLLELASRPRVHFVAVSEAFRDRAIRFGIPANKVSVRYIGIDLQKFVPGRVPIAQRQRQVLFIGRLVEKKGCGYLIEAMDEVQK